MICDSPSQYKKRTHQKHGALFRALQLIVITCCCACAHCSVPIDSDRIVAVQLSVSNSTTLSIVGVYFPTTDNPLNVYKGYLCELENVVYALQRSVQLSVSNSTTLSIVGVYFPTTDNPLNVYKGYLCELENVVYALQRSGPVVIIGDFNAHIGKVYSNCVNCQTNSQGHLLLDMIDRTGHYAVSLSDLAMGPAHTFSSGGRNTTVDFCFIDCWAAHLVLECEVLSRHPLNLSDHLPLKVKLDCNSQQIVHHTNTNKKLNWRRASSIGSIENYQNVVSSNITPFLERPLVSIAEVDQEIASVNPSYIKQLLLQFLLPDVNYMSRILSRIKNSNKNVKLASQPGDSGEMQIGPDLVKSTSR